jgi:hypothetical protein
MSELDIIFNLFQLVVNLMVNSKTMVLYCGYSCKYDCGCGRCGCNYCDH